LSASALRKRKLFERDTQSQAKCKKTNRQTSMFMVHGLKSNLKITADSESSPNIQTGLYTRLRENDSSNVAFGTEGQEPLTEVKISSTYI
jgi:hypothetical protein